jgi:hypothetical protein
VSEPRERLVTLVERSTLRALWREADARDLGVGRLLDRILRAALPELARERHEPSAARAVPHPADQGSGP